MLLILAIGAIALAIVQTDAPHWQRSELLLTGAIALLAFVAWARHPP